MKALGSMDIMNRPNTTGFKANKKGLRWGQSVDFTFGATCSKPNRRASVKGNIAQQIFYVTRNIADLAVTYSVTYGKYG